MHVILFVYVMCIYMYIIIQVECREHSMPIFTWFNSGIIALRLVFPSHSQCHVWWFMFSDIFVQFRNKNLYWHLSVSMTCRFL